MLNSSQKDGKNNFPNILLHNLANHISTQKNLRNPAQCQSQMVYVGCRGIWKTIMKGNRSNSTTEKRFDPSHVLQGHNNWYGVKLILIRLLRNYKPHIDTSNNLNKMAKRYLKGFSN